MTLRIVRLGTPRARGEGLRLGTVRRLPRGVRKTDYAKRDWFDLWLPELAPSEKLFAFARANALEGKRWTTFAARYRRQMSASGSARLIELLARLSREADVSVGCYCEDESRCHRSVLRELLREQGAKIAK
jgi:uncharacterized protein YeaO (DUF488 family)